MKPGYLLLAIPVVMAVWSVVHGGTRDPQPSPIWDDHDVSGLLEED
jgi:hypothetical protein